MRTSPTGRSSTSGVLPISSRRLEATALRTALPHVDRRAELADHLVDAPEMAAADCIDRGAAMRVDELAFAPLQAGKQEQGIGAFPRSAFDHPFAPLAFEPVQGDLREACVARCGLDIVAV